MIFTTPRDTANELEVAAALERVWNCQIYAFGPMTPLDFYALRDGCLAAVLECKTRSHASDLYPTVFLSVRKWLALTLAEAGLGVPGVFVVRFVDGIRWVHVHDVDGSAVTMAGTRSDVIGRAGVEPVVLVPIDRMHALDLEAVA